MGWLKYTLAIMFNALGLVAVYALQRLQLSLPLNPQSMANVSPIPRSTPPSVSSPTPTGRAMAAKRP
jgi:K+-transporting ATPase A subunit